MAPRAGLAARRRGRGQQAAQLLAAVGEVSALRAVERVAEGRQRRRGALGLAEGTPGVQTWTPEGSRPTKQDTSHHISMGNHTHFYKILIKNRHTQVEAADRMRAGSLGSPVFALAAALLPVKSRCSVLLLIPLSLSAIHRPERKRERERELEEKRRGGEGRGAWVMAEGAKMAGASQGTAQQRAFTEEPVKGGRTGLLRGS